MLIGYADGRKISAVGVSFERRSFLGSDVSGAWVAEIRPLMAVSDPTITGLALNFPQQPQFSGNVIFASQVPVDSPVTSTPFYVILVEQNLAYLGTATYIGGRRTTYAVSYTHLDVYKRQQDARQKRMERGHNHHFRGLAPSKCSC